MQGRGICQGLGVFFKQPIGNVADISLATIKEGWNSIKVSSRYRLNACY